MRILHTSDWHLGQHFMGRTRTREHKAFIDWLLKSVDAQQVEAIVVAGDIFDTGTPPSYARTLYNEFIVALRKTCCRHLLILGGNHDSEATLNEGRSLLAYLNTRVTAGISDDPEDHVIVLEDKSGSPGLILCAVPFLRPRDLVRSIGGQSGRDKQLAVGQAIQSFYTRVFEIARKRQDVLSKDGCVLPILATGHLTVVGGKSSDSVRDIYIGSLDAFPASGFPEADYIALGHLHRGQTIKDREKIRYSGSPIPLSFDESGREKQVLIVDFKDGELASVSPLTVPCFRRMVCLKGNLDEIEAGVGALTRDIASEGAGETWGRRTVWLEAEVREDDYLTDLQDRIQTMIADQDTGDGPAMALLRVRRRRKGVTPGLAPENRERLEELNPTEVFSRRIAAEFMAEDQVRVLNTLFEEILDQVETASESGVGEMK
jgi:exonuclease SbcD